MPTPEGRLERASVKPLQNLDLPEIDGIGVAMRLKPEMGIILRSLADNLLVKDFPGSTLTRFEREAIAAAVSAQNDCYYCMDSHMAHALAVADNTSNSAKILETMVNGEVESLTPRLKSLLVVALNVAENVPDHQKHAQDVEKALTNGVTKEDVQLAIFISAGFSMYNRLVQGFNAKTPPDVSVYTETAQLIAQKGYLR